MKLIIAQKEKLNDFKNAYMRIFNSNNNEYMSLVINTIFDNVEKNYEEFSDEIEKVSINQENDELNILKQENGYYSLLDFLLNRVFKNIQMIDTSVHGNGYEHNQKELQLSIGRYDKYYKRFSSDGARLFSDDFLMHQRIKSIMHESGHAFQNKRENDRFPQRTQEIRNQLISILKSKYDLNNRFVNVSNSYMRGPFESNPAFGEGLNEMYASLFSGVLNYNLSDSNLQSGLLNENVRADSNGRSKTSLRRNCFNGYQQCKYFYQLRALVSKQSIFNSMYFGKNDMINEFCNTYKEMIDKYEMNTNETIKNGLAPINSNNFFVRLLQTVSVAYNNQYQLDQVYKYEKILDSIFIEAFQKRVNSLTTKDKLLQSTLGIMYSDSYVYIENGKAVDSDERVKYLELYKRVEQLNKSLPEKNTNRQESNSNRLLAYGIFDVNVISNPDHDMKIIVYLRNGEFEVNQIELKENNDFTIIKDKNSICKLIEKYLDKHKQELIDNPRAIIELFNNIGTYIPEITISRNNGEYESGSYGSK